jgi:hypothetical protein
MPKSETSIIDADDFEKRVEMRAYELYLGKGSRDGQDWNDWFEAQQQIEAGIDSIDKDCIRSESFYKTSHRSDPAPSGIGMKTAGTDHFVKDL